MTSKLQRSRPVRGLLNNHLTHDAHGGTASKLDMTFPGQAHFVEPSLGKTCRECALWGRPEGGKYERDSWGILKPARCEQYFFLTNSWGPPVPHSATACRHFKGNPAVPEVQGRGR
jgi:hypothetical protein